MVDGEVVDVEVVDEGQMLVTVTPVNRGRRSRVDQNPLDV